MIELSRTFHELPHRCPLVDEMRRGARLAAARAMRFASLTFTLALTVAGACGDSGPDPDVLAARELPAAVKGDAAEIARSSNQFALDLYARLAADPGNLFLSPFSISTALAMTSAGAAGVTDQELRQTLHFTLPGDRLHTGYRAMLDSLDVGRGFGLYTLATANRVSPGFADNYGIRVIFPPAGGSATAGRLAPGELRTTGLFKVFAEHVESEQVIAIAVPALDPPADFASLVQPDLEGSRRIPAEPAIRSPLQALLVNAVGQAPATRSLRVPSIDEHTLHLLAWRVVPD